MVYYLLCFLNGELQNRVFTVTTNTKVERAPWESLRPHPGHHHRLGPSVAYVRPTPTSFHKER